MNKRIVLAVAVIAEIALLTTASAIFAGYFNPKQQTPKPFTPSQYEPPTQVQAPVQLVSTPSPPNSPPPTSPNSSSQQQTSTPLQTSQSTSPSPEDSQTSAQASQRGTKSIFDVSVAYAYAGPTNASGTTPNHFGFPNVTMNPSNLYPTLVYLNFTLLPTDEKPACDYKFEAYLVQFVSDTGTSQTYVYYEGTNFYAVSPGTLPNPTVNDLTDAGPQTDIRPGAGMYLNWPPGQSTLGRITDSGSYQSGQSGLGLWNKGQPNTITVTVTWLGSIAYTGSYAQTTPSNNETVAQVQLSTFGNGFLYNAMVPPDQLAAMDPLDPPTPKTSASLNPSQSYLPAPSPTPKPTPPPGTKPMFDVNVAYAYVGPRDGSTTSPNQPLGGTLSNASCLYPNVAYLTFASTGSQSCDAKIEVYLIRFSSDTGVNQSYVYTMGANYTASYSASRVQGMTADVNDFVEFGPNSSMMIDNGISVQNHFNTSLVTGAPYVGSSVSDFGWGQSGPSGLGIWNKGQPSTVTLAVYRLGWVALNGQSISVTFANPNDIAVEVQLSKFGNGFLYNTILSPDRLSQIDLFNPPILNLKPPT